MSHQVRPNLGVHCGDPGDIAAGEALGCGQQVVLSPIGVDDAKQIERGITAFAHAPNGGLVVLAQPRTLVPLGSIIKFAAEHRLPAVYNSRLFTVGGGLISYGSDILDQYRLAAGYVDHTLKGEKPPICRCRRQSNTSW